MKIKYNEAIALGFEREDAHDKLFEGQNGYEYFIVTLNIGRYAFGWDIITHEVTLYKDTNAAKKIETREEFNFLINLLKEDE